MFNPKLYKESRTNKLKGSNSIFDGRKCRYLPKNSFTKNKQIEPGEILFLVGDSLNGEVVPGEKDQRIIKVTKSRPYLKRNNAEHLIVFLRDLSFTSANE